MFSLTSAAIIGIEAVPVHVEVDILRGLKTFVIVGLPDASVKESRDRIKSAIRNSGFRFPRGRVVANLAPADVRKQGPLYDLPIALAVLVASGVLPAKLLHDAVFLGELALDGRIRPVQGALISSMMTKRIGKTCLFVPTENVQEALAVHDVQVFGVSTLSEVVDHLLERRVLEPGVLDETDDAVEVVDLFTSIKGQEVAKRGIEIAAAGGHNILLNGPPGAGKTLLAKALPGILPPLVYDEAIEVTAIASVAGQLASGQGLVRERPFRTPHHSASATALIGGGAWPRPGEVSLAHRGVLFLDEMPEFSRYVLEHLRQPLEDGHVTISRAAGTMRFPSRFLLVAAMNPCPCGHLTNPSRQCVCTLAQIHRYQKKLSGPLLDRFDLVLDVPAVKPDELMSQEASESSEAIRDRVLMARDRQRERFSSTDQFVNAEIGHTQIETLCPIDSASRDLLKTALQSGKLSARGFTRVRKVARTIADLAESDTIELIHLAEALHYRGQDANQQNV